MPMQGAGQMKRCHDSTGTLLKVGDDVTHDDDKKKGHVAGTDPFEGKIIVCWTFPPHNDPNNRWIDSTEVTKRHVERGVVFIDMIVH